MEVSAPTDATGPSAAAAAATKSTGDDAPLENLVFAQKHTEMMKACASGDVGTVRKLLAVHQTGDENDCGGGGENGGNVACLNCEKTTDQKNEDARIVAALQDDATGKSPLMIAAEGGCIEICKALLEAGAPWNALDRYGQCAGNYATDNEHWDTVNLMVEHGTKAELILGASMRLAKALGDGGDSSADVSRMNDVKRAKLNDGDDLEGAAEQNSSAREGSPKEDEGIAEQRVSHEPCTKPDYLNHNVRYNAEETLLLDDDDDAVMMEWERPIMNAHASILTNNGCKGKCVLNVGFGLGIVDSALQTFEPKLHVIIEAHPAVYKKMCKDGWDKKQGVRICFGRWQDELPKLIKEGLTLDGVFYDTYGEHSHDLEDFHDLMAKILSKPDGIYSFFNGLAPDNLFFHGVACNCVKLQLSELGFDTEFAQCQIEKVDEKVWEGVRRPYWHGRDTYYLPISTWKKDTDPTGE